MKYLAIILNICFLLILPFAVRFAFLYEVFAHYLRSLGLAGQADASTNALYYNTLLFPVLIVVGNIASWIFFIRRKYPAAFYAALLPFISILLFLVILNLPQA